MKLFSTQTALVLSLLPLALLAAPASAQLTLTLAPTDQFGSPGDLLSFSGTLSNPTANSVFLNNDSVTFSGPAGTDGSPFLSYAPFSLDPMGTVNGSGAPTDSYNGSLFTLTLDPGSLPGTYLGTFSVLGGADGAATSQVASADFSVTVLPSAPQPIPELSSTVSLGLLLALGGLVVIVKRRRTAA